MGIGWEELPNSSKIKSRNELQKLYEQKYPDSHKRRTAIHVSQIWTFVKRIQKDDLIIMPLRTQSAIAISEVKGEYKYRKDFGDDMQHTREVKWLKTDIPRTAFDQDILYSLGALSTICQIKRDKVEERMQTIIKGKTNNGNGDNGTEVDIEQASHDQIIRYINEKFKGHGLARIVEAVLQVQGYVTKQMQKYTKIN